MTPLDADAALPPSTAEGIRPIADTTGLGIESLDPREVAGRKLRHLKLRVITNATEATFEDEVLNFFRGETMADGRETGGQEKVVIQVDYFFDGTTYSAFITYTD